MSVSIALSLGLLVSIALNAFCFWYCRQLIQRLTYIGDNIEDLVVVVKAFRNHIEGVSRLEQFYGDQEIKELSLHAASLSDVLQDYSEAALIMEPIEYEDEPETQQKEQINAEEEV